MAATQRASLGRPRALAALLAVYARVTTATGRPGPDELMRPSRCAGWTAGDVLYRRPRPAEIGPLTDRLPLFGEQA
jgi:hypothetical protein